MVIFVAEGSISDETRRKEFYGETYNYFKDFGLSC